MERLLALLMVAGLIAAGCSSGEPAEPAPDDEDASTVQLDAGAAEDEPATNTAPDNANRAYNDNREPFIDAIAGTVGMDRESTVALLDALSFPEKNMQLSEAWLGGTVQQVMKEQMDFFAARREIDSALPSYDAFVDTSFLEAVN